MSAPYAGHSCALSGTRASGGPPAGSLPGMEFSGAVATAYAEHRRGYPPPVVDLLVDAVGLPRNASVLDLGCGTGQLTVPLAGRYDRVIGADPSPDMLALARSRSSGAPVAWLLADDHEVTRLPLLAGLDAVTVAQAIHLLDRMPLFEALATRMSTRARIAIVANGSPLWLRDLPWSRALNAYLGRWFGTAPSSACGTDAESRDRYRTELASAGFRTATEVALDYRETHTFDGIVGNVRSALSPGSLPTDPAFEAGLRDALGPGPFEEDVRVAILVAAR
jgi:SAM-dependent methyltransferase